ncbi:MAG: LacI family DNA-binding transcriptional regulator [Armatimonadota bacterium]
MKISQESLANELRLSLSTISRALRDDPHISVETRARVKEAAQRLGYRPNLLATSFRTGTTRTLGLIVMDITNPFYTDMARGSEDCAHERDFSVILGDSDASIERESLYLEIFKNRRVDGILITPISGEERIYQSMHESGIPYVLIDAYDAHDTASSVTVDHIEGAYRAVRHLIDFGHSRIGFLGGALNIPPVKMMLMGYKKALSEANLKYNSPWVSEEGCDMEGGYLGMHKLLDQSERVTAVICTGDLIAIAAIKAIDEHGLRIPQDFSLVGYDDIPLAARVTPALTTVVQNKYELGRIGTRILIHEIASGPGSIHQTVVLRPRLEVRGSTGPVKD